MIEKIQIQEQNFILHSTGVLFWEEKSILLISDVHLGKISHFRKYGSAVPQNAIAENFTRLNEVVAFFNPKKIYFMGDMFHSSLNMEWDLFENWLQNITSEIILVAGNHDIISSIKYEALGIKIYSEIIFDQFLFTHHPEAREGFFNFCGHLHPGFKLNGTGRQQLKLRCFYENNSQMILPAFGEFTGNFWISPKPGDKIYAVTKKEVILVY